jgi:hypothetical protein
LRGYHHAGIPAAIRTAGGEMFGITSEPQTLASEAREAWDLDFECVGDPHHEIVEECRARGWLDLFVNPQTSPDAHQVAWFSHPRGFLQPGVLALSREGRVLYRWRSRPTRKNAGGATGRPLHDHVWECVQRALGHPASATDAPLDRPPLDVLTPPWPLFVFLLLANGNFIRPRTFPMERGSSDTPEKRRAPWAIAKAVVFVAAWIVAFATLPPLPVAAAFVLWAAAVTPGIVALHRLFQNEPGED